MNELPLPAVDVLQPFAVCPAIEDPTACVHHAMHRIGTVRSFVARLTCRLRGRRTYSRADKRTLLQTSALPLLYTTSPNIASLALAFAASQAEELGQSIVEKVRRELLQLAQGSNSHDDRARAMTIGDMILSAVLHLCPMQWPQSNTGIWTLPSQRFVFGQDASQIQRQ